MIEEASLNRGLSKVLTQLIGKPGSLRFRLTRDTVGVMVLRIVSMGLGFLVSVILARLLDVHEFGLYTFAMSLLGLLVVPATFGFPQLLVREIAAYRAKEESGYIQPLLSFAQRTILMASLLVILLVASGLLLFSYRLSQETLVTLGLTLATLPVLALIQLYSSTLRGLGSILVSIIVSEVLRPLSFLLLICLVCLSARNFLEAEVAIGLQTIAACITLFVGWFFLRNYKITLLSRISFTSKNKIWFRSAIWLFFLALLNLIPQHSGVLLLGVMHGTEEAALYKVAYQTASLIPFGLMTVNVVIAPTLSQLYASKDRRKLQLVVAAACGAALLFAFPLVLLFLLAGSKFLQVVFGDPFALSGKALSILAVGQIVNVATGPVGMLLLMSGHERISLINSIIGVAINLFMNLTLIPFLGIVGASIAAAITAVVVNLLALFFVTRKLGIIPLLFR